MKRLSFFLRCGVMIALMTPAVTLPARGQQTTTTTQPPELEIPFDIFRRGLDANNYLAPLLEFRRREAEYARSEKWRRMFNDLAAQVSSYVGDYETAYEYYEKNFMTAFEAPKTSALDDYKQLDALDVIASLAGKQQVVMINEEHDTPMHRAFTSRLLPILYAEGYRYLAAETLGDTEPLNRRGYPNQKTGFYTADPVFGDMLRTAHKLGFKIVHYEHNPKERCVSPPDKPDFCQNERERGQAQNLYDRIFRDDPRAKVLVHVGRGHNQELKFDNWAMMGWHFREISKIDPFTINQMMSERGARKYERPLYQYVTRKWVMREPTVFRSAAGEFHKGYGYDLELFHPRTVYERGRPTWLRMGGSRRGHEIELKKLNLPLGRERFGGPDPILVQAFVAGEGADAVPVDQVVLYPGQATPVLVLPKAAVKIRAIDEAGRIIGSYTR